MARHKSYTSWCTRAGVFLSLGTLSHVPNLRSPCYFTLLLSHGCFPPFFLLSALGLFISHSAPLRFQTTRAQSLRLENFSINLCSRMVPELGGEGLTERRRGEREGKFRLQRPLMQGAFGGRDTESRARGPRGYIESWVAF